MDELSAALIGVASSAVTAYVTMRVGLRQQEARFRQELELKITELQQRETQWRRELALRFAELRSKDGEQARSLAQQFAVGVVVVGHGDERTKVFVPPSSRLLAGRAPDCDIVLQTASASRHHFAICSDASGAYVEDLGSHNGVWVNDVRVQGRQRLHTGDLISIASDVHMEFQELR